MPTLAVIDQSVNGDRPEALNNKNYED